MKENKTYTNFLRYFVLIILIGQLWANVAQYGYWLFDVESDVIELCSTEDSETEKKENQEEKKDKEYKIRTNFNFMKFDYLTQFSKGIGNLALLTLHHPEIITPPPKYCLV